MSTRIEECSLPQCEHCDRAYHDGAVSYREDCGADLCDDCYTEEKCPYKHDTGDKRYPVLCKKNGKRGYYVTQRQCDTCKADRRNHA